MPVCIGALCSNACVHASMCTNVHVCGCVLEYSAISSVYLSLTGPLGGEDEPLVIGGGGDTDSLVVDQPVVAEGVAVGQVTGLGGERLLHSWDRRSRTKTEVLPLPIHLTVQLN